MNVCILQFQFLFFQLIDGHNSNVNQYQADFDIVIDILIKLPNNEMNAIKITLDFKGTFLDGFILKLGGFLKLNPEHKYIYFLALNLS